MDTHPQPNPNRPLIAGILILGLIVGAVAGGLTGALVASGRFQLLNAVSTSLTTDPTQQTVSVTEESAAVTVVEKASPAVVSVIATKDYSSVYRERQSSPFGDLGLPFFWPEEQTPSGPQQVGAGTGFIVSADGTIVTNKHVVEAGDADSFTVVLNDERSFSATVVAKDPTRDVAILDIDAQGLPIVELGDSSNLQVGQVVVAIGNALGEYRNTATRGIISGLARTLEAGDGSGQTEVIEDAIQTDAAINRGNSGGPLLNLAGQAIGINTATSLQGQNISFAIPIQIVKDDLESVRTSGKIVQPFLGVCYTLLSKELAEANTLPRDYGALLQRGQACAVAVVPGSPADKAGLVENDIILEFDGQQITSSHTLQNAIGRKKVGDQVKLKIYHDGDEKDITATLEERK